MIIRIPSAFKSNRPEKGLAPRSCGRPWKFLVCCLVGILHVQAQGTSGPRPPSNWGSESPPVLGNDALNVRLAPYGAKGDGKKDDTKAIQAALDAAGKAGGRVVFVPDGTYLIKGHLTVPAGTSLVGTARAPRLFSEKMPGSTLLAVEGAGSAEGPAFVTLLGPNSTLQGITVFYPNQIVAAEPVAYPWTVRGGGGDNVSILDVLLVNPYQGVDLATQGGQRHYIRGLYGQPLLKGVWVSKCYDIGRIHDVHFWPFWSLDDRIIAFTMARATAFTFQRADWEVVENIFCWGYRVGMELSQAKEGGMNGQMSDVDMDSVDIGIDARYTQPPGVAISNLAIANDGKGTDHIAIWGRHGPDGANLFIRGGSFWGDLNRVVLWEGPGTISLSESCLVPWSNKGAMVELSSGQAMIHDNLTTLYKDMHGKLGSAVLIHGGVRGAIIHGNVLDGNTIDAQEGARVTVSGNQP